MTNSAEFLLRSLAVFFNSNNSTKNPLSLESDKGFGLYIVSTGLRLREDSSFTVISKTVISDIEFS
jgi:hypothetical protein